MKGKRTAMALLLAGLTWPAAAAEIGGVQIHVAGEWAMGGTDGNAYLNGDEDRDYHHRFALINLTATPVERLFVGVQLFAGAGAEEGSEVETEVDYAFAQWTFSDAAKLRAGVSRHPFGIYSETLELGTARTFFSLPQSIYGPGEFVSENYQGLGLTGFKALGDRWEMRYDLYGGALTLDSIEVFNPHLNEGDDAIGEHGEEESLKDLFGGRLLIADSSSGLEVGFSAFSGTSSEEEQASRLDAFGVQVAWLRGPWSVRGEWAHSQGGRDDVDTEGSYIELARRLGQKWEAGVRWDHAHREPRAHEVKENLEQHQELAATLNYWFSEGFVIKLSVHDVKGNLFAFPREEEDVVGQPHDDEEFDEKTRLVMLGAQFSF